MVILAEVYELDRDLLACSIAIASVGLLLVLPLWLAWFGYSLKLAGKIFAVQLTIMVVVEAINRVF